MSAPLNARHAHALYRLLALILPVAAQNRYGAPGPEELSRTLSLDAALFHSFNRCDFERGLRCQRIGEDEAFLLRQIINL